MKQFLFALLLFTLVLPVGAQTSGTKAIDQLLPVRGLAIAAPSREGVNLFVKFIDEELAPAHINLLVLRIDWNYAYESHPELRDHNPLSRDDLGKIVDACRRNGIRLVPQINLLGHQSWAKTTHNLLRVYPEFDETPHVNTETDYTGWPNDKGLYCKSYCPLHPDVHKVVFALIDELMEACDADWFHAGMDEVFYIGDDNCPRCSGRDKAELFAGEVTRISNHLASKKRRLMIWGDRLIDGKTTGVGLWEGSYNNTYRAIDMIPKSVFICDWHYDRAEPTPVNFATKGFDVAACPWNVAEVAAQQLDMMINLRQQSNPVLGERFRGVIATVWTGVDHFLKSYYDPATYDGDQSDKKSDARTLKSLLVAYKTINNR